MILVSLFVLVSSQTFPTAAQDEYDVMTSLEESFSFNSNFDDEFTQRYLDCQEKYANVTFNAPYDADRKYQFYYCVDIILPGMLNKCLY